MQKNALERKIRQFEKGLSPKEAARYMSKTLDSWYEAYSQGDMEEALRIQEELDRIRNTLVYPMDRSTQLSYLRDLADLRIKFFLQLFLTERMNHLGTAIHLALELDDDALRDRLAEELWKMKKDPFWAELGYSPPADAGALEEIAQILPENSTADGPDIIKHILIRRLRQDVF
jgi:hypothetical protein